MSRYKIESENGHILYFGYDPPMKTFFADLEDPEGDFIVEIGPLAGLLVKTPQAICRLVNENEVIKKAGLDVMGSGCEVALQEDLDNAPEPTPMQLFGLETTGFSEDGYEAIYE